jgi:N-acyl-L-homoserine lactone synthetase
LDSPTVEAHNFGGRYAMPYIAAGRLEDLPPEIRAGLGAYRYEVFVRRLGWTLPSSPGKQTSE